MKCSVPVDIISVNPEFPKVFDVKRKGDSLCIGRILSVCKWQQRNSCDLKQKGRRIGLRESRVVWAWLDAGPSSIVENGPLPHPSARTSSGSTSFWGLLFPHMMVPSSSWPPSSHLRNPRGVRGPFPQWFQFVSGLILRASSWAICHCGHGVGCY